MASVIRGAEYFIGKLNLPFNILLNQSARVCLQANSVRLCTDVSIQQ